MTRPQYWAIPIFILGRWDDVSQPGIRVTCVDYYYYYFFKERHIERIPRPYPTHHKSLVGRPQDATFGISFPNDSQSH